MMYKHVSLRTFQLIEGETGTDSRGYGNEMVRGTNIYTNPDVLPHLQTSYQMAELNREQIALTLKISPVKTDTYFLVISYLNPDRYGIIVILLKDIGSKLLLPFYLGDPKMVRFELF